MPSLHAVPVTEGLRRFKMWYFCFLDSMDTEIITLPPPPFCPIPSWAVIFPAIKHLHWLLSGNSPAFFHYSFPPHPLERLLPKLGTRREKCDPLYRCVFFIFVVLQQCVVSMENGREIWSLGAAWMLYPYVSGPSEIKAGLHSTASSALVLLVQTLLVCSCKEHTQD